MRVLLARIPPGQDPASVDVQGLVGKPVFSAPGSGEVVGRCTRVQLSGREVWATLELDMPRLPSELLGPLVPSVVPVSVNGGG